MLSRFYTKHLKVKHTHTRTQAHVLVRAKYQNMLLFKAFCSCTRLDLFCARDKAQELVLHDGTYSFVPQFNDKERKLQIFIQ